MESINTSTFDFPTLILEGLGYVDKTAQIHEVTRRFGKLQLISTFKAFFSGWRELFRELVREAKGTDAQR